MHVFFLIAFLFVPSNVFSDVLDPRDAAQIHRVKLLEIIDPWAKPSFGGSHTAKLFFEFRNEGRLPDKLTQVRSPLARGNANFKMVTVKENKRIVDTIDSITVPVGKKGFELSEVGYYIELANLELPILMGSRFPVTLTFERSGAIEVEFIGRFHSPKLNRRIRQAAARGDIEALKAIMPSVD